MRFILVASILCCALGPPSSAIQLELQQGPGKRRVEELAKRARSGEWRASFELAKLGKRGVRALTELLKDRSLEQRSRYMAANALGESGSKEALPVLLEALRDRVMNVRRCAASALGILGDERAMPALEKLAANDPYVFRDPKTGRKRSLVRDAAEKALERIRGGGQPARGEKIVVSTDTPASRRIPWVETVEDALALARKNGKPLLATVVPLSDKRWSAGYAGAGKVTRGLPPHPFGNQRSSRIDAGLVKERMLMASVFSDPEVIDLVRAHFVPVRLRLYTLVFDRKASSGYEDPLRQLGTSALETTAPALVFASGKGRLVHACRRLGVFSALFTRAMLRAVLRKLGVKPEAAPGNRSDSLERARDAVRGGRWKEAGKLLAALRKNQETAAEASYLLGYVEDKLGNETRARGLFRRAVEQDPEGPWGSRAGLRLGTTGGRLDEWETLAPFEFDPLARSTEKRVERGGLDALFLRAVDYLLRKQRPSGEWADPFVDMHPMSAPGTRYDRAVARTGIVVDALMKLGPRLPERKAEIARAVRRGIDFVGAFADEPKPWIWQLTYGLHLQIAILRGKLPGSDKARARQRVPKLLAKLRTIQHEGGWSYMSPPRIHTFNTAPVLLMLSELRDLGIQVPEKMAGEAAAFLERCRRKGEPREFSYASNIHHEHLGSSSCRTALCELALERHRKSKKLKRLRAGLDLFFREEPKVRRTTKIFEAYFSPDAMHDAYHHYFGHYYAARALEELPREAARRFAKRQLDILLGQVELDGSFVDAQMQGKSYSTAMALLTLALDLEILEK
ncbi:MAG: HEAT repeat domain-containing protein [Planctomycetota bacterium]